METGILFNVQRFSVHDGPGIRTTLFFRGARCGASGATIPRVIAHGPS